tara:strand:+ start:12019 stop:12312 length:294 start_codon:yes stop_codon:yes gene_type:complete
MNFKEIAENYSKQKRSMMTNAVVANRNYTKNFTHYHSESLSLMFAEWHLLFPQNKQDINCTSCRAAVCKFWETMVDEWIETEQTPKKKNAPKKRKTK